MKPFGESSSRAVRRWWITSTWNCSGRLRRVIPGLWVPIILALSLWVQAQAPPSLPDKVGDYRAYLAAEQHALAGNHPQVIEALKPVWTFTPVSPLLGKSAVLAARSYELLGQYADALQLLRNQVERLPQPEGWILLARNAEAAGDNAGAAAYYQRVFFEYPAAKEVADAEIALGRLQAILGEHYPPAMPQVRLERAARLAESGAGGSCA